MKKKRKSNGNVEDEAEEVEAIPQVNGQKHTSVLNTSPKNNMTSTSKQSKQSKQPKQPKQSKKSKQPSSSSLPTSHSEPNGASASALSSPYSLVTSRCYLSISPAYSANPSLGIQLDHLDPLVFKYDAGLGGVVLSHQNLRFSSPTAKIMNESPFAFAWCTVEFLLWKPQKGMVLEGWVNNASPSHVGMLFANIFSVSIAVGGTIGKNRVTPPADWEWFEGENISSDSSGFNGTEEGKQQAGQEQDGETGEAEGEQLGAEAAAEGDDDQHKGATTGKKAFWHETTKKFQTTGYWRDEWGKRVEGNRRFQVMAVKTDGAMVSLEGSFTIDESLIPRTD